MQGRRAGTIGAEKAKNYLVHCYQTIGLKKVHGSFTQSFTFPDDSTHKATATNIIGMINNRADSTIIIGAHYDHLGLGGPKSLSLVNNKIHPGADDNASGVAMMLMLARYLEDSGSKKYNYLFIAFSAEEEGLYGSQAFAAGKLYKPAKTKLMLNLVMVGRLDTRVPVLKIMRSGNEKKYDALLGHLTGNNFGLHITAENINYTDAEAFIKNNIPSFSFSTGVSDDYHKITDTPDKINYAGMETITAFTERFINALCK